MAGTVTQTHERRGPIGVHTLTITGDSSDGSVPSTALSVSFSGKLLALETNPGTTAPTDDYDIVITDSEGHDVLQGVGADRDATSTEFISIGISWNSLLNHPIAASDVLTLALTNNSVNSAVVVLKLYYEGTSF